MAFVSSLPLRDGRVELRAKTSNLRNSTISAVAPSPGRSKVFDAFQSSQNKKNWVGLNATASPKEPGVPEGRSKIFFNFMQSKNKSDFGGPPKETSIAPPDVAATLALASTPFFRLYANSLKAGYKSGGDARKKIMDKRGFEIKVDDYIASCAKKQYIMAQNSSGVFSPSCTEGTVRGAAEDARVAALANDFRRRQISGAASFTDYYEVRKLAFALAQGCNYEESLINRFPFAARATVIGNMEKVGACNRYATPKSAEEKYMAMCVERASSARSTPYGEYCGTCSDGTVKGAAETKRVAGLATKYRMGMYSASAKEQMKYDQSKFARNYFSGGCSYENDLFTKYPATAASMRPSYARY